MSLIDLAKMGETYSINTLNLKHRPGLTKSSFEIKEEVRFDNHFSKIGLFSLVFAYKTFLRKQFVILPFNYFAIAC